MIPISGMLHKCFGTLESGIDVGQGITVGPGKFVKKNKHGSGSGGMHIMMGVHVPRFTEQWRRLPHA